jgi:predicted RNA-binding protein associated with RNAse of E/G family
VVADRALRRQGRLAQFYFDITDGSFIDENGEPSFYDLMLDVVALPDGGIYVLDRDELDRPLRSASSPRSSTPGPSPRATGW